MSEWRTTPLHRDVPELEALQIARAACEVAIRHDLTALPERTRAAIVRLNHMIRERTQQPRSLPFSPSNPPLQPDGVLKA